MEALIFNNQGLFCNNLPLSKNNPPLIFNNLPLSFYTRALLGDKRNLSGKMFVQSFNPHIYGGLNDGTRIRQKFHSNNKKNNRHIVTFYYRRDKMFLCVCACTHIYKCKHERTKSARTSSLNTSPCKICRKAFQHFLESHVKSVRRLRKKRGEVK